MPKRPPPFEGIRPMGLLPGRRVRSLGRERCLSVGQARREGEAGCGAVTAHSYVGKNWERKL